MAAVSGTGREILRRSTALHDMAIARIRNQKKPDA